MLTAWLFSTICTCDAYLQNCKKSFGWNDINNWLESWVICVPVSFKHVENQLHKIKHTAHACKCEMQHSSSIIMFADAHLFFTLCTSWRMEVMDHSPVVEELRRDQSLLSWSNVFYINSSYSACRKSSWLCTWFFTFLLHSKNVRMFNRRACRQKYTAWHETALLRSGDIWKLTFLFSFKLPQTMSLCERWRKAIQLFIFHVKGSGEQEPLP